MEASLTERMILVMLADITKHLGIKDPVIKPDHVLQSVQHGALWALDWIYSGRLGKVILINKEAASSVWKFIIMWSVLDRAYQAVGDKEKAHYEAETGLKRLAFPGFDPNTEADYYEAARFFVEHLGECPFLKENLTSKVPRVDAYTRMYEVFEKLIPVTEIMPTENALKVIKAGFSKPQLHAVPEPPNTNNPKKKK